jgi:hypothetical protein
VPVRDARGSLGTCRAPVVHDQRWRWANDLAAQGVNQQARSCGVLPRETTMKLTVTESVSLDGVMQWLDGPDEGRSF